MKIDYKNKTIVESFLSRYKKASNGCWNWVGSKDSDGYGKFIYKKKQMSAHRFSYLALVGEIINDLTVDHICKNIACVNPNHLRLLTMRENLMSSNAPSAVNARKTHCKNGHQFSKENTYITKRGGRTCRACRRVNS